MTRGFKSSPQQCRAWSLRGEDDFNTLAYLQCRVPFQPSKDQLSARLAALIERHEILRSTLDHVTGYTDPFQFISSQGSWALSEKTRERGASNSPHIALELQADGTSVLQIQAPSTMLDARSLLLFAQGLLAESELNDETATLQFADVAAWLNDMLSADETAEARGEFQHGFAEAAAAQRRLSIERVNKPISRKTKTQHRFDIPTDITANAIATASNSRTPLEVVLVAAWLEVLRRVGGGEKQSSAIAFDGACGPDLEKVLGPLTRYLPLCAPPSDTSLLEALNSVGEALDNMRDLQECFFSPNSKCNYQYGFAFTSCPEIDWQLDEIGAELDRWQMHLHVFEDSCGLHAELLYDASAIRASGAEAIAEQWLGLLGSMRDLTQRVSSVSVASPAIIQQARKYGEGRHSHQTHTLLEWLEYVLKDGEDRTVTCDSGELTLHEINIRANALALDLVNAGVEPGSFVGLHINRSSAFLVGMLAAVKAGAAYVPLDISMPPARLAAMLATLPLSAIISASIETADECLTSHPGFIQLDDRKPKTSKLQPNIHVAPDSPLYALFTSGSTGAPKPVVIPHRALLNHMSWMIETFSFTTSDRFLFRTKTTFDASVWEYWAPLLLGADLIVAGPDEDLDIDRLLNRMQKGRVSVAQFVPTLLELLVQTDRLHSCSDLRLMFCGGEALMPSVLRAAQNATTAELVNLYGPTECCIDAAFWRPGSRDQKGRVAIGVPINNTSLYVMTEERQLSGIGIPGELYIGGAGLFSGYWGMDDLTDKVTIASPFDDNLLYKTGDLARLADDGLFEFFGRLDDQVKINGYRIELQEIDAALTAESVGGIAASVVTDDRQLIGFVVGTEPCFEGDILRERLNGILPPYMIPSQIFQLDQLPLNSNGKVNRQRLKELASVFRQLNAFVPLDGEIEEELGAIWSKVLGVERIGATDSFFLLGGDSIRSIQVAYEARMRGLEVTVRQILRLRTIRDIALAIRERPSGLSEGRGLDLRGLSRPDLIKSELADRVLDCYPASQMQSFMVEAYKNDLSRRGVFHAQQGYSITGSAFDPEAFSEAVKECASTANFRTRFLETQEGLHQLLLRDGVAEITSTQVSGKLDSHFEDLIEADRLRAFDAFNLDDALLRVHVVSQSDGFAHRVLISNHHAIQDGWGNVEFLNDLAAHMNGETVAHRPENSAKELAALEAVERPLEPAQIADLLGTSAFAPHSVGRSRSKSRIVPIERKLAASVIEMSERLRVRPKSIIVTAFCLALEAVLRLPNPLVGVVANGRDDRLADPLRAMGLFWYLAPFRLIQSRLRTSKDLANVEDRLLKTEANARAFWTAPTIDGSLLAKFTFNFVHFHNWSGGLDDSSWCLEHRLDDFGADIGLSVGFDPNSHDPLALILDSCPDHVDQLTVSAVERALIEALSDLAQYEASC